MSISPSRSVLARRGTRRHSVPSPPGSSRPPAVPSISCCSTRRLLPSPTGSSAMVAWSSSATTRRWRRAKPAPFSTISTSSPSRSGARPASCARRRLVVDKAVLASKIAAVRDATARIRSVLPPSADAFRADRTAREVVIFNLLVAIQTCLDLAAHWLADEGWDVPPTYGDIFVALANHGVIDVALARRLAAAAGLRNLVARQYGT